MTLKLNHDDAILIFGDLQSGITDLPLTIPEQSLRRSAKALAQLAELYDIPTIALCIPKGDDKNPTIIPEISENRSEFQQILRTSPDSFDNEEIRNAIAASGRKTLIVCGVATEIVVSRLALSGIANGYQVYLVVDVCGGLSQRSEEAALRRLQNTGVVLSSVVSLAGEITGDFTMSPGREAVGIVYQLVSAGYGH